MQISSYTFQSPYPQPFQVGRPDPASSKQTESSNTLDDTQKEPKNTEAKLSPTKASGIGVSIGALMEGGTQDGVAAFKALSTSIQGQKAYAQEAVS